MEKQKKDIYILSIESSCDETSAAIVKNGREIISNVVASQIDTHTKFGGVVPEIASRMHIEAISHVVKKAFSDAKMEIKDINAVAVTKGPGLIGALMVGLSFAKAFAYANNLPLYGIHHLEGHIAANYLAHPDLKPPFLALVISGGHTHLAIIKDYLKIEIVGRTKDDAIGEAYDKVARVLGLGYPGGPKVDRLAKDGNPTYDLPKPKMPNFDFSFSGIKTAIINMNHNMKNIVDKDLAKSFEKSTTDIILEKALEVLKKYNLNTICLAGGVSANSYIRGEFEKLKEKGIKIYYPPINLCTDNAAMIGSQAYYYYINSTPDDIYLDAKANLMVYGK